MRSVSQSQVGDYVGKFSHEESFRFPINSLSIGNFWESRDWETWKVGSNGVVSQVGEAGVEQFRRQPFRFGCFDLSVFSQIV